eukprot:TRINITY_DN5208_c0_g2_i4.p2 TRINITY_DN5208_c0_g2~~TRINITY_DN5208_c0_g2_i4.p2  ORF type:complete len:288 (-),score=102.15 TRINITY_DN5208_c0_g2_i4:473-1336(-)
MQGEVLEDLKNLDGNILEMKKKLVEKYGRDCFEPAEKEEAKKNKQEFLADYLHGTKASEDFSDFFYSNDLQDKLWDQIKAQSIEEHRKEAAAFDKDFPALPSSSESVREKCDESWKFAKSANEKVEAIKKHFPVVERQTIEYVLFNFSYQVPPTINYLRNAYPENYIEIEENPGKVAKKPDIIITKSKPKIYQLRNGSKNDSVKKVPGQKIVGAEAKYSEIRKDAATYLRLFHIYMRNKQLAHTAGQHSEANKFKQLADDYYELYVKAKDKAVAETLVRRFGFPSCT